MRIKWIILFLSSVLLSTNILAAGEIENSIQLELQHIINCQVQDSQDPAYGAINNVWGEPTWVMPGEMAIAAIVLHKAGYVDNARAACDYLVKIQNADGSWCNQYNHLTAVDKNKYARHTAQVIILFGTVGGYEEALNKANLWLESLQDTANKSGWDDGLICGGMAEGGSFFSDRWVSDNSFAVLAFHLAGNILARDRVINGINQYLFNRDHWYQKINSDGVAQDGVYSWINFAPAFLNLDNFGVIYPSRLARWMNKKLQLSKGSLSGAVFENRESKKLMPGIGFQASLAWQDLGAFDYADKHTYWAENVSGLWQATADVNGDAGGWVDWKSLNGKVQAQWWEKFIDTSAYYVMVKNNWKFGE